MSVRTATDKGYQPMANIATVQKNTVRENTRGQNFDWISKKLLAPGQKAADCIMRARCDVEWQDPATQPDHEPWKYQKPTKKAEIAARIGSGVIATVCIIVGIVPAFFGVPARFLARYLRGSANYRFDNSSLRDKLQPISIMTFNVAGLMPAATLRNGLRSFKERFQRIFDTIIERNADIVVLQEAFNAVLMKKLAKKLKKHGYTNYIFNVDTNGFGVSSGLAVFSKVPIESYEFKRFPKEIRGGFGKWTHKGVLNVIVRFSKVVTGSVFAAHKNGGAPTTTKTPDGGGTYRIRQTRFIQDWIKKDPRELKISVQDTNCSTLRESDKNEWDQERKMIAENFPLYAPWNPPDPEGTSSSYNTDVGMVGWDLKRYQEWFDHYRKPNNNLDRILISENPHLMLDPKRIKPDIIPGKGGSDHCPRIYHFVPISSVEKKEEKKSEG